MRCTVSNLSHYYICPSRARIEGLNKVKNTKSTHAMKKGIQFHFEYQLPYKSLDRRILLYQLKYPRIYERTIEDILVRGIFDDLRILIHYCEGRLSRKTVQIIELKTTSKDRLYTNETEAAIFQLQLYIWLLKPILEDLSYQLHDYHLLEVYSQKDGSLIKRIPVTEHDNIEEVILHIVNTWKGLEALAYPEEYMCKRCPRSIKEACPKWISLHSSVK